VRELREDVAVLKHSRRGSPPDERDVQLRVDTRRHQPSAALAIEWSRVRRGVAGLQDPQGGLEAGPYPGNAVVPIPIGGCLKVRAGCGIANKSADQGALNGDRPVRCHFEDSTGQRVGPAPVDFDVNVRVASLHMHIADRGLIVVRAADGDRGRRHVVWDPRPGVRAVCVGLA